MNPLKNLIRNINIEKYNNFFILQFFLVFPLLLIPNIFFFIKEYIFEMVKIIEYILFLIFVSLNYNKTLLRKYLSVILLILLNIIITFFYRSSGDFLNMSVRIIPFISLFISLEISKKGANKIIQKISFYNLSILLLFLILGLVIREDINRNPYNLSHIIGINRDVFFLVSDNLHNTAYLVLIFLFPFLYQRNLLAYSAVFIAFILVIGYGVRTVQVAFLLMLSYYLINHIKEIKIRRNITYILLLILCLFLLYCFIEIDFSVINKFSSGRIFVWNERLNILSHYNLKELFFGKGYGSDLFISEQWIWGEELKGSHNDFLTFIFHGGLFSLALLLLILWQISKVDKLIVLLIIVTSILSNAFLFRPIHFMYLMFMWQFLSSNFSASYNNSLKAKDIN